ncbi:MAG TPA: GNAT family N-acetyltransferase, partial [Actinomycetota bacterium]|nr:GNAT family N-acetyltransferase [Actinomycetota bacterium]
EVRVPIEDELPGFFDQLSRVFSGRPQEAARLSRNLSLTELDRTLVASEGRQIVGTAGVFSLRMTTPGGGDVPTAGVTRVSVAPTHRRQGLLRALMRRQLDDVHARGEPLAALYASQAPIYGRFGYGVGTWHSHLVIPRARSAFRDPPGGGRVRFLEAAAALEALPDVYERIRREQPGAVTRSQAYWQARLTDPPDPRQDRGPLWFLLHEGDRGPDGFAVYQVQARWQQEDPNGTLFVIDLLGANPVATAALWRFCLDVDLMARVEAAARPAEDPVRHLLADTRAARVTVYDGLWVRLVDVGAALGCRSYAAAGPLTIEVRDDFCPWNAGRWCLEGGECRRSDADPDLVLDVADLAAVYLGGERWATLAAAGRVEERAPGSLKRADAIFASSPAPWCPTHF